MRAYVNSNCTGCGFCISVCPDVFFENKNKTARASAEHIPNDAEVMVIEAKNNCPAVAIETTK